MSVFTWSVAVMLGGTEKIFCSLLFRYVIFIGCRFWEPEDVHSLLYRSDEMFSFVEYMHTSISEQLLSLKQK